MGERTGIAWTRSTHNEVIGCAEKSEACAPCYARTLATRWYDIGWGKTAQRLRTSEKNRRKPFQWNAQAEREGSFWPVFAFSLADWAEPWHDPRTPEQIAADMDAAAARARARGWSEAAIARARAQRDYADWDAWIAEFLTGTVAETTALTWQLLTKRAEQVQRRVPAPWASGGWPAHVWLGLTTESQRWAALRLVWALAAKQQAGVPLVFCSAEPLYGPLDLERLPRLDAQTVTRMLRAEYDAPTAASFADEYEARYREFIGGSPTWNAFESGAVDWVITGGQSAGDPRRWLVDDAGTLTPQALDWLRQIRDACARWDVAFFHKQHGGPTSKMHGKTFDGEVYCAFPGGRSWEES